MMRNIKSWFGLWSANLAESWIHAVFQFTNTKIHHSSSRRWFYFQEMCYEALFIFSIVAKSDMWVSCTAAGHIVVERCPLGLCSAPSRSNGWSSPAAGWHLLSGSGGRSCVWGCSHTVPGPHVLSPLVAWEAAAVTPSLCGTVGRRAGRGTVTPGSRSGTGWGGWRGGGRSSVHTGALCELGGLWGGWASP